MNDLYLIKKETLTNIADNVRNLTGIEGEISLDTVENEIATAKESVEDVKDALGSIGFEIPNGSNIGDLAEIIENNKDNINSGTDTSDATITPDEVFFGETAYGTDGKVTGTFTIDNELSAQDDLISQIYAALEGKAGGQSGIRFDTGSFVLDTDISSISTKNHNLGVAPNFVIVYTEEDSADYANYNGYIHHQIIIQHYYQTSNTEKKGIVYTANGVDGKMTLSLVSFTSAILTADTFYIAASSSMKFKAGITYRYVCGVLPGIREVE